MFQDLKFLQFISTSSSYNPFLSFQTTCSNDQELPKQVGPKPKWYTNTYTWVLKTLEPVSTHIFLIFNDNHNISCTNVYLSAYTSQFSSTCVTKQCLSWIICSYCKQRCGIWLSFATIIRIWNVFSLWPLSIIEDTPLKILWDVWLIECLMRFVVHLKPQWTHIWESSAAYKCWLFISTKIRTAWVHIPVDHQVATFYWNSLLPPGVKDVVVFIQYKGSCCWL